MQPLSLFVEIAMEYQTQLDFKYRLQYYDYTLADNVKKRLGYTLILPAKDAAKKKPKAKVETKEKPE